MPIPAGYKAVAIILTQAEHDALHAEAYERHTSVSSMLAERFRAGTMPPLIASEQTRTVRSNGRELFLSFSAFLHGAGKAKGDTVRVTQLGPRRLIITAE